MIEGRIAGSVISQDLGFIGKSEMEKRASELEDALGSLREGMFAPKNRGKLIEKTEEGIDISMNLLEHDFVADDEIERYPGVTHRKGIHPVIECTQNIPCNPCQDTCPKGCISIGANITSLPTVTENPCIGCGMCVASCSGQAIFLVDEDTGDGYGTVTLPYEFLPIPEKGTKGVALGRDGHGDEGKIFQGGAVMIDIREKLDAIGPYVPAPDDDMLVCRCEEVTKGEIRQAVHAGMLTIEEIRRFLRCGMGLCQGQTCGKLVKSIVARKLHVSPLDIEPATSRAPMRPTEMRILARDGGKAHE